MHRFRNPFWKVKEFVQTWILGLKGVDYHMKVMNSLIDEIIKKRTEETEQISADLLGLFMRSDDWKDADQEELRAVVLNFILAGRDTTANALSWAFYELCKSPVLQEEIYEEVERVCSNNPNVTMYELQSQFVLINAV